MGFDTDCILDIQSLAGEYFCPVCRLLVYPNEALQSQCTHLYCKPCLKYIVGTTRACPYDGCLVAEADSKPLVESNNALAETIGRIAVHCLYHRSGCTWQGPLSECTSHSSGCAFGNSPVVCNRCGVQIVHCQVQEHTQNCPGVQPRAQQAQGVQGTVATATAAVADQSQTANQSGAPTSQSQTLQATAAPPPGFGPNPQIGTNSEAQAIAPAGVPAPEKWFQQQYQQYYQQYPGCDFYQQTCQHYNPYQQQAIQHYQQQPQRVQGQNQPRVYIQPQQGQHQLQPHLQPQAQFQPQAQSQSLPQPQPQPHAQPQLQVQPHAQPQLQVQAHAQPQLQVQPQPHPLVQPLVAAQNFNQAQINPQQKLHPAVHPHTQMRSQIHPPLPGYPHLQPQPQLYPQAHPHPVQAHPQDMQIPQYQQPHSQMQHLRQQIHPQPQPQPQVQPQANAVTQPQQQAQLQHHPHPQLQASQPQQLPNPNAQSQTQHPPTHAVIGHYSHTQPQAIQQMQLGAPQQHPRHMHLQNGPLPPHPAQIHGQFPLQPLQPPQMPPQMHRPQPHPPMSSQQQPALLPSQGQVSNIPSSQQQPIYPHAQQPGHPVNHQCVMEPIQQPVPQQYVQRQQQQGQALCPVQSRSQPQDCVVKHQQQPMQPHLHPQGLPNVLQQNSNAYLHSQHFTEGVQVKESQNYVGKPMMPNHGAQLQQTTGGFSGPMQFRANQPSSNQNYPLRGSNQLLTSSEQLIIQSGLPLNHAELEKQGDHMPEKCIVKREARSPFQRTNANSLVLTSVLPADSVEVRTLKSKTDVNSVIDKEKPIGGDEGNTSKVVTLGKDPDSQFHTAESDSAEAAIKPMAKKESTERSLEPLPGGRSVKIVAEQQKEATNVPIQVEHFSVDDASLQQAKSLEEQTRKFLKDAVDAGMLVSTGADKGSQAVPLASAHKSDSSIQNLAPQGNSVTPLNGRDPLQHDQERKLSQSHLTRGPGVDEFRRFPPRGQVKGKGLMYPAHPVPLTDQGRHQQPPMYYGPSSHQQGHVAPSLLQAGPPTASPHRAQVPGQPPTLLKPQGHGHLPGSPPEHFQQPVKQLDGSFHPEIPTGGFLGPGSTSSLRREPSHIGLHQKRFEVQSGAPLEQCNQCDMPPPCDGLSRISEGGRPIVGLPQVEVRTGSFDSCGGIMRKEPPHGPEGQVGQQQHINPMETEIFSNQRSCHFYGRQPNSHLHETLESGTIGQLSGVKSNVSRSWREFDWGEFDWSEFDLGEFGPVAGFGRHHNRTRGFGNLLGVPPNLSALDDIDGNESHPFGEGRFPLLPSHMRRGELEGLGTLRGGDLIAQNTLPSHLRRGEHLGPRDLPSHLRLGEPAGFGVLPGQARVGELTGSGNFSQHLPRGGSFGGNKLSHPCLGERFGSSYFLQGYPNDGGFYTGSLNSFDNSRKRKSASMGWCRICKVHCETVEGLDLHSQTREHQTMAMDMVLSIKQQNAKKRKTSNDHPSLKGASTSRSSGHKGCGNKS